jgi:hypothetical protein
MRQIYDPEIFQDAQPIPEFSLDITQFPPKTLKSATLSVENEFLKLLNICRGPQASLYAWGVDITKGIRVPQQTLSRFCDFLVSHASTFLRDYKDLAQRLLMGELSGSEARATIEALAKQQDIEDTVQDTEETARGKKNGALDKSKTQPPPSSNVFEDLKDTLENWWDDLKDWISEHKTTAIVIGAGLFILIDPFGLFKRGPGRPRKG